MSCGHDDVCDGAGKKQLESAVLHCLSLLDLALQKEVLFMDLLRESQASMLVSSLEQLLQGVNPQSRRADHIINIARYAFPVIFLRSTLIFQCWKIMAESVLRPQLLNKRGLIIQAMVILKKSLKSSKGLNNDNNSVD